jgi:hypothetical protein
VRHPDRADGHDPRWHLPAEHKAQIQGSMWITEYEEWDFCSYSQDMPAHLRTYIFTVKRDEEYIANLEREVRAFLPKRTRCSRV